MKSRRVIGKVITAHFALFVHKIRYQLADASLTWACQLIFPLCTEL